MTKRDKKKLIVKDAFTACNSARSVFSELEDTAGNCVCIRSSASALLLLAPASRREAHNSKAFFNIQPECVAGDGGAEQNGC